MNIYIAFTLIAVVAYLIGSVNFARIIGWFSRKKDITKLGSGNPGTMNMLRTMGFVPALFTFLFEIGKTGLCCLLSKYLIETFYGYGDLAFYFTGLFVVLGSNYPIYYNFKGGKGVACTAGIFLFSPLWWIGLIIFFAFAIVLAIFEYGFISSLAFILGMAIATTIDVYIHAVPYAWLITVIVWTLTAMTFLKHRGNFRRFFKGQESKIGFKRALSKVFKKQKGVEEISEEQVESVPEAEIVIEDIEKKDE